MTRRVAGEPHAQIKIAYGSYVGPAHGTARARVALMERPRGGLIMPIAAPTTITLQDRIERLDWHDVREQLDARGFAVTAPVLGRSECEELSRMFHAGRFRSTVDMA